MCADRSERAHSRPPSHVLLHRLQRFVQGRHQLLWQTGKTRGHTSTQGAITVITAAQEGLFFPPGYPVLHSDKDCHVTVEG